MQLVLTMAGKYGTDSERGKHATAQENMQFAPRAGKYATRTEQGKTCNRFKRRENLQRTLKGGKHATDAKSGKKCTGINAGKH